MKAYTYYIPETGEVIGYSIGAPEPTLKHLSRIDGAFSGDRYYISAGSAKERREFPVVVSGLTITGIPNKTQATVNGQTFEVTDGVIQVVRPGSLKVEVQLQHMNYLYKELTL